MSTQYLCKNERRRTEVLTKRDSGGFPLVNGIDYLSVSSDRKTLFVYFLHDLKSLSADNIIITGGVRFENIQVESVSFSAKLLSVNVSLAGDLSTYTLRLIKSNGDLSVPSGFDPQLSHIDFSFWVENSSELDCQTPEALEEKQPPPPFIDYLAKDYTSFRQLMLDRLAVTMPSWQERNPSDVGMMLVELLAYAADYLSYYQDAVATEAYLGTARKRVSVRRHARLLDYFMHDGCNARAWVTLTVTGAADEYTLPGPVNSTQQQSNRGGTQLLTKINQKRGALHPDKLNAALNQQPQIFETLHDLTLYESCNEIKFYTWDDDRCRLFKGATSATFIESESGFLHKQLQRGRAIIFEEIQGAQTGETVDLNQSRRHVVRLTEVKSMTDPLRDIAVVEVKWSPDDALPFDLWISNVDSNGKPIINISVARGNVVLVDHGRTIGIGENDSAKLNVYNPGDLGEVESGLYRPQLEFGPLTQQGYVQDSNGIWQVFDSEAAASAARNWQMRDVKPSISVWEVGEEFLWRSQQDLLNSDRFSRDFVVETEDNGKTYLRFGDDVLGKQPEVGQRFQATYRVGNGTIGNVGAEAIAHIVTPIDGITNVRNPLPAGGGTEPEAIEKVRLEAPEAFRVQQRAVTEADYAAIAQRFRGVDRAIATRRWTGSWYTIFITVDREGGLPVDADFKQKLLRHLESFRLAGHDLQIQSPRFVALDIAMIVEVAPDYFRSNVKEALLTTFSATVSPSGKVGFFNPNNFTFNQPVYLSQIIATAMQIPGVISANITRFQRWGEKNSNELENGQINFEKLEIARVDNNPNAPESGRIVFEMQGGV